MALGGRVEPDGPHGRLRLAGRRPDPRTVAALAGWCAERGLLLAELRTTGGTLEERFLELIAGTADDQAEVRGAGPDDGGTGCGADAAAGADGSAG
jgi:hypothetical protein